MFMKTNLWTHSHLMTELLIMLFPVWWRGDRSRERWSHLTLGGATGVRATTWLVYAPSLLSWITFNHTKSTLVTGSSPPPQAHFFKLLAALDVIETLCISQQYFFFNSLHVSLSRISFTRKKGSERVPSGFLSKDECKESFEFLICISIIKLP